MTLDEWVLAAADELGLALPDGTTDAILDLARDVAHAVERPAAPITAYLAGLAVGRGADLADVSRRLTARATAV